MTATARSRRASISRKLAVGLLAACTLALLPTLALAKKSDREQPMNYQAKHTDAFNAPNTVTTLTGDLIEPVPLNSAPASVWFRKGELNVRPHV